jgi:cytochrome c
VAAAASCQFNGQAVASGSSVNAFQAASVPFATTCTSQARTCTNGTLSGSYTFASCSVAAAPAIDGAAIYTQNCSGCHGALATSSKRGASAATITSAIQNISYMKSNPAISALTPAQIDAISKALGN